MYTWSRANPCIQVCFSPLVVVQQCKANIQGNLILTTAVCAFLTKHLDFIGDYPMTLLTFLTTSPDLWLRSS